MEERDTNLLNASAAPVVRAIKAVEVWTVEDMAKRTEAPDRFLGVFTDEILANQVAGSPAPNIRIEKRWALRVGEHVTVLLDMWTPIIEPDAKVDEMYRASFASLRQRLGPLESRALDYIIGKAASSSYLGMHAVADNLSAMQEAYDQQRPPQSDDHEGVRVFPPSYGQLHELSPFEKGFLCRYWLSHPESTLPAANTYLPKDPEYPLWDAGWYSADQYIAAMERMGANTFWPRGAFSDRRTEWSVRDFAPRPPRPQRG